jgi:geranylgeranyl reductase family protein
LVDSLDVVVIGAGPSGCRTAELISKKGYKVLILEEHTEIGRPLQCAGLVSWRILDLLPNLPREIIINEVRKAKFFSPSGNFFTFKSKKSVYVISRIKLDEYLAKRAKGAGAKIKTSTRFERFKHSKKGIKIKTNKGSLETKLLIGADGVNSRVAKISQIKQPDHKLIGVQTTVEGRFDSDLVEVWFGSIAPKFFAWIIPENEDRARVGLVTPSNCRHYFDKFLKKRIGKIKKPDVSGILKFGLMKNTVSDRVLLVGDSACQVKPLSGGGLTYGLIGAGFCAGACIRALRENRFDKEFLEKEYDTKWKEKLGRPIKKGLSYRKILDRISDRQLNFLFSSVGTLKLTKILEFLDMDLL